MGYAPYEARGFNPLTHIASSRLYIYIYIYEPELIATSPTLHHVHPICMYFDGATNFPLKSKTSDCQCALHPCTQHTQRAIGQLCRLAFCLLAFCRAASLLTQDSLEAVVGFIKVVNDEIHSVSVGLELTKPFLQVKLIE